MKLTGKQTWEFENPLFVNSSGTAVGPKEKEGPLGHLFDKTYDEMHCNQKNWEMAERKLMEDAVQSALSKQNLKKEDIDIFLAGDLLNQNVTANYVARHLKIPFLCLFGACSTSMESIAISSALIDGGFAKRALAATSSHNATAERQFRYPTEYGGQKPGTATSTVTGSGAVVLSQQPGGIKITSATVGRVIDLGITDSQDMGSAMAPAAADTIKQHLEDLGRTPDDYDLILTGDLSGVGSPILKDLLKEEGINVGTKHNDCGLMIYTPDQQVFAGGSGCACSAVVTFAHIFKEIEAGRLNRVLVVATGALLSPTIIQQKESIPCIAHGVVFERAERGNA
ncbi:stage V sporulation protein AD [Bacillus haynesii]|uniref:stage V sporulation protein AD n=1 Tax=Bacillus TaxID=1386 RepID=UPI0012B76158|nr:stage V sporulation protein AD [Bacillus haynesii]TWK31168.1 Stage V sporulation protein AD [Bacillus licheniformis]MBU8681688.1 stage V sporulation protein AD [Bacillus haynesii]MCY7799752.1 stage V sporulation protein AD [Bacillus haynesii]MCY7835556.1 stage V sporulation protein AD [Bacillus haynesii]MCY7846762.1 stage V sporulation protein AD [Bacillus haynesii]